MLTILMVVLLHEQGVSVALQGLTEMFFRWAPPPAGKRGRARKGRPSPGRTVTVTRTEMQAATRTRTPTPTRTETPTRTVTRATVPVVDGSAWAAGSGRARPSKRAVREKLSQAAARAARTAAAAKAAKAKNSAAKKARRGRSDKDLVSAALPPKKRPISLRALSERLKRREEVLRRQWAAEAKAVRLLRGPTAERIADALWAAAVGATVPVARQVAA